MIIFDNLLRKF